jgi:hypothetical protein
MKKTFLTFLTILFLVSCSKDETPTPEDPLAKLPPETQTGANIFGCIINGQVFYPRGGTGTIWTPGAKAVKFWGAPSGNQEYNEIEVSNYKDGKPASNMIIHLQDLNQNGAGEYIWHPSNFQRGEDGLFQNYVFARIYNASTDTWKYYGSYENSGKVVITRYDTANFIVSGTFSGKLRLYNGTEEIEVSQGRFDFNKVTLDTTTFP